MGLSSKYPFTSKGFQYAEDILSGKIKSCIYVKGACKRFFRMYEDQKKDDCEFFFSFKQSERFLDKVQKFVNPSGLFTKVPVDLSDPIKPVYPKHDNNKENLLIFQPWQCFFWMNVFGFIFKRTGQRLFNKCYLEAGRGNGKTTVIAGAVHYISVLDKTLTGQLAYGNFSYSAATKLDQAELTLNAAKIMLEKNEDFKKHAQARGLHRLIKYKKNLSEFKPLSSKTRTLDGLNVSAIVIDEVHSVSHDMMSVLKTGMAKRVDALMIMITTAGLDMTGPGFGESEYAKEILKGLTDPLHYFCMVYTLDKDDDEFDESNWVKSNPNLGVSVRPEILRENIESSKNDPVELQKMKTKHLNIWSNDASQYMPMEDFKACQKKISIKDYAGEKCFVGIDLAGTTDITSVSFIFQNKSTKKFASFSKIFLPKDTFERERRVIYQRAFKKGELILTPGKSFNNEFMKKEILKINELCKISCIYYDKYNAIDMVNYFSGKHHIKIVDFAMTAMIFTGPMKRMKTAILENEIEFEDSGLLYWCFSNVEAKIDLNDNVFPRRKADDKRFKIDPAVSNFMAMRGYYDAENNASVYEDHSIRRL